MSDSASISSPRRSKQYILKDSDDNIPRWALDGVMWNQALQPLGSMRWQYALSIFAQSRKVATLHREIDPVPPVNPAYAQANGLFPFGTCMRCQPVTLSFLDPAPSLVPDTHTIVAAQPNGMQMLLNHWKTQGWRNLQALSGEVLACIRSVSYPSELCRC
jgi:hypothetical protein